MTENPLKARTIEELYAIEAAISEAVGLKIKKLVVFYNHPCVKYWSQNKCAANSHLSRKFQNICKEKSKLIELEFKCFPSISRGALKEIASKLK